SSKAIDKISAARLSTFGHRSVFHDREEKPPKALGGACLAGPPCSESLNHSLLVLCGIVTNYRIGGGAAGCNRHAPHRIPGPNLHTEPHPLPPQRLGCEESPRHSVLGS